MSYYDVIGACGVGCAPGAAPFGYAGYPSPGYSPPGYGLSGPVGWDIIGQPMPDPMVDPNAQPSFWDRTKAFLAAENSVVPVTNQNLLLGAAALGTLYYGYSAGWFGRRRR